MSIGIVLYILQKSIGSANLSMLNVNVRSIYKTLILFFLHGSKMNFNIIGLVESCLKDKPLDYFHLDDYN